MFATPRTLLKSPLAALAFVAALALPGREADAQVTYVGTFALANAASDQFLSDPGNSLLDFTDMIQYDWEYIPAQEWAFFRLEDGFYAIMNVESGLFLEDPFSDQSDTKIDQDAWVGGYNQQWFLCPMGGNFYALVNASSGLVLTDPASSTVEGQYLWQDEWIDDLDQWWYLAFLRY